MKIRNGSTRETVLVIIALVMSIAYVIYTLVA